MAFGVTVNGPPPQNAPIHEFFETRGQKIARDSNPFLKLIESANAAECFPQYEEAAPFPY